MQHPIDRLCDRLTLLGSHRWFFPYLVMLLLSWRLLPFSPADPDLFARLGMGRLIQSTGAVPLKDPFAFTERLPLWIDHEWLSGVVFLWLVQHWGDAGLIIAKLVLALLSALFIVKASALLYPKASGQKIWVAACLLHASFLWGSTLRCQAFTYLFVSYLLFALAYFQTHHSSRYLWFLPLISIPWINLHGGWAMGMSALGVFCAASAIGRKPFTAPLLVMMLCALSALLTPYGPRVFLTYLFDALRLERSSIPEWAPLVTDFDQFLATLIFGILIIAGGLCGSLKNDLRAIALLCFSAYCGFQHIRFLGFFMFCAAVYGAGYFSALIQRVASYAPSLSTTCCRAVTTVATALVIWAGFDLSRIGFRQSTFSLDLSSYPITALDFLEASGESGRLLVDFNNGSFALWRLYPRFLVSLDGRYEEVYPESTVREVSLALLFGTSAGRRALEGLAPTHILTSSQYLFVAGLPSSEWLVLFNDGKHAVLRRGSGATTRVAAPIPPRSLWQPLF